MNEIYSDRIEALMTLLAQPDPPDLTRGHRSLCAGAPDRTRRWAYLPTAYVQHQRRGYAIEDENGAATPVSFTWPARAIAEAEDAVLCGPRH